MNLIDASKVAGMIGAVFALSFACNRTPRNDSENPQRDDRVGVVTGPLAGEPAPALGDDDPGAVTPTQWNGTGGIGGGRGW
jgi:hypothetical protein